MNKHTLNYEQVASIADKMKEDGQLPSLLLVSSALKQTKISSKLLILLEQWYQQQRTRYEKNQLESMNTASIKIAFLPKKYEAISKALSLLKLSLESTSMNKEERDILTQRFLDINQCLEFLATHDETTELLNCTFFADIVDNSIKKMQASNECMAFILIDLDHFKVINHTIGYHLGNKVLKAVANRLLLANHEHNTVAHYGGDEFIVLAPKIKSIQNAQMLADEINHILSLPFNIDDHVIRISASLGVSMYPYDGCEYEALINHAELSMYHAKEKGRNTHQMYSNEVNAEVRYSQMAYALQHAIKKNEFHLVFQPVINLKKYCVESVEALLRWNTPQYGNVPPMEFISLLESNDLIFKIGEWVIEEACIQVQRWHQLGLKDLTMAVNVSARQLQQHDLPVMIKRILKKTGLLARYLELELTENSFIENTETVINTLQSFKEMGIKLSIDDFGTGYSCLSYLKRFPVDRIKIDKAFLNDLSKNPNNAVIIQSIIHLGHSLNLEILAEGVENTFQKQFIIANGCDYGQGFYFQTPEKADALFDYLSRHKMCP